MDIAQVSMDLSQGKVLNAVGTSMLSKSMDLAESQIGMMTESMSSPSLESLVYPGTQGTAIDIQV